MKKPTSTSHKNPVSIKAYNEFTRRIRSVFSKPGDADDVIRALDKYLNDEPDYGRHLNSRSVVGMSFLLYDVNQAIERSRRARERAARRRAAKDKISETQPSGNESANRHSDVACPVSGHAGQRGESMVSRALSTAEAVAPVCMPLVRATLAGYGEEIDIPVNIRGC